MVNKVTTLRPKNRPAAAKRWRMLLVLKLEKTSVAEVLPLFRVSSQSVSAAGGNIFSGDWRRKRPLLFQRKELQIQEVEKSKPRLKTFKQIYHLICLQRERKYDSYMISAINIIHKNVDKIVQKVYVSPEHQDVSTLPQNKNGANTFLMQSCRPQKIILVASFAECFSLNCRENSLSSCRI